MSVRLNSAVEYIKKHAKDDKPFFMDINFMKMHNPNNPAKAFAWEVTSREIFGCDAGTRRQTSAGSWM